MGMCCTQAEASRAALLMGVGGGGCSPPATPKTARLGGPGSVLPTPTSAPENDMQSGGRGAETRQPMLGTSHSRGREPPLGAAK